MNSILRTLQAVGAITLPEPVLESAEDIVTARQQVNILEESGGTGSESMSGAAVENTTHNGRPAKDLWDKFKIMSEVLLPLAALIWAVLSWVLLQYHEKETTERQAQAAIQNTRTQERISAGQIAATLIPRLVGSSSADRKAALLILATVAPDLAGRISQLPEQKAAEENAGGLPATVNEISKNASADRDFLQSLRNARTYLGFGLYAAADRSYLAAAQYALSNRQVNQQKLSDAKSEYAAGSFEEAANTFEQAFRDIPNQ